MAKQKILIYQVFTRLFGNRTNVCKHNGTIAENGCGKLNFFSDEILRRIKSTGYTHVWYTGIVRHASRTNYSGYGIPTQHPAIVKGNAGSPYAITDYYDVDPDLAENVDLRMEEFLHLVERNHNVGLKAIIDFVPNHVARQYQSVRKPNDVKDLGEDDDTSKAFSQENNFYYCPGQRFQPSIDLVCGCDEAYQEFPARATGNDKFSPCPCQNDWYETVKLNYGVDYCDAGGKSEHFEPIPNTWKKMADILLFWAAKGVDGFRCDMAEMVPPAFWRWAIAKVRTAYPNVLFIAEVYNPLDYNCYVGAGFDFLYDKVGMYDTMRSIICGHSPTSQITTAWQWVDKIHDHMLYFLENHDEQRIASDYFAGNALLAYPAFVVNILMRSNPFMVYAGQEYGERGMDEEGFSGRDGRTTIFDYWTVSTLYHAFVDGNLSAEEEHIAKLYTQILHIASMEKAIGEGDFFDLMYVNEHIANRQYAFFRKAGEDLLFVVANFDTKPVTIQVNVPDHAFDFLSIPRKTLMGVDMLDANKVLCCDFMSDKQIGIEIDSSNCRIIKFRLSMSETENIFNEHNKEEFPPAHTAEHLLNQTMIRMFGCERSSNAHIERKKSKMSFILDHKPTRKEEKAIENKMNELIAEDLPVRFEIVKRCDLPNSIKTDRLPIDASENIQLVRIGDYDVCPCIGKHVRSTSQIGKFVLLGTNWNEQKHTFRIRYKIV